MTSAAAVLEAPVVQPAEEPAEVSPPTMGGCNASWGSGCPDLSGPHVCLRDPHSDGQHECLCGARN